MVSLHPQGEVLGSLTPNPGAVKFRGHFSSALEQILERLEQGDSSLERHVLHKTEDFVTLRTYDFLIPSVRL